MVIMFVISIHTFSILCKSNVFVTNLIVKQYVDGRLPNDKVPCTVTISRSTCRVIVFDKWQSVYVCYLRPLYHFIHLVFTQPSLFHSKPSQ